LFQKVVIVSQNVDKKGESFPAQIANLYCARLFEQFIKLFKELPPFFMFLNNCSRTVCPFFASRAHNAGELSRVLAWVSLSGVGRQIRDQCDVRSVLEQLFKIMAACKTKNYLFWRDGSAG
jgi:hypothetical protein